MLQTALIGLLAVCGSQAESTTDIWPQAEYDSASPTGVDPGHLGEAKCSVDLGLTLSRLMSAGLDFSEATKACSQVSSFKSGTSSANCITGMTNVMAAIAHVGEFLLEGMASCPAIQMEGNKCTSALVGLVGDLNTVVGSAANLKQSFKSRCQGKDSLTSDAESGVRKNIMGAFDLSAPIIKNATCANDVTTGLGFLAKASDTIASATKSCGKGKTNCFITVTAIVDALAYAGSFLAMMVQDCTYRVDHKAVCAAKVGQLVAGVTGLASHGGRLVNGCGLQVPGLSHFPHLSQGESDFEQAFSGMYNMGDMKKVSTSTSATSFVVFLIALLPLAAMVGFASGSRRWCQAGDARGRIGSQE